MSLTDRIQKGRKKRTMRNLIYGGEKVGKSEFAAQFPKPLTLSYDDGVSLIDTSSVRIKNWNDGLRMLHEIHSLGLKGHGYQTLNIDPLGWAERFCIDEVCKVAGEDNLIDVGGGYGAWKEALFNEFGKLTQWTDLIHAQGMHVNFVAHAKVKKWDDPSGLGYNRYTLQLLNEGLAERMRQSVDNVLFLNFDSKGAEVKEGGQKAIKGQGGNRRIMHTERTAAFDAGNRFGFPDRIELSPDPETGFKNFWQHYEAWSAKTGTKYPEETET